MILQPRKTKFRKVFKPVPSDILACRGHQLNFALIGLKILEPLRISAQVIECIRIAIARCTQRKGKVHFRIFPHVQATKKPLEVRMGSGKGSPDKWYSLVRAGTVLVEIAGIDTEIAETALRVAQKKIGAKTIVVKKSIGML